MKNLPLWAAFRYMIHPTCKKLDEAAQTDICMRFTSRRSGLKQSIKSGRWALYSNLICFAHCLLLPLIPVIAPFSVTIIYTNPYLHWGINGLSALITFATLLHGYKSHRRLTPFLFPAIAYGSLFIPLGPSRIGIDGRTMLLISIALIFIGLIINWRLVLAAKNPKTV